LSKGPVELVVDPYIFLSSPPVTAIMLLPLFVIMFGEFCKLLYFLST